MARPFHNFAKEAEKLSPLSIMSEQTKVCLLPLSHGMPGKDGPASAAIHVCQIVLVIIQSQRSSVCSRNECTPTYRSKQRMS